MESIRSRLCKMTTQEVMDLAEAELHRREGSNEQAQWIPLANADCAFIFGQAYLIRTVTMTHTGRVVCTTPQELVLEDAAWIPDTGRFSQALEDPGILEEVEPSKLPIIVGRGGVIDAYPWPHRLPRLAK